MQYLLTEEEYRNLVPKKEIEERRVALAVAKSIILKISGYECHRREELRGYCDDCPCGDIDTYPINKLICTEPRSYSK